MCKTITEYNKLETVVVGGTKGKFLTESIMTIFEEFGEAVAKIKQIK